VLTAAPRPIQGSVVVVVGASSGVGRATAVSLGAAGARLVLVARREAALEEVAADCRRAGAQVLAVPADIADAGDVDRIVSTATAQFGHVDTWINCAARLVVGEIHQQSVDDIRGLIETNVLGTTLTSRAAMIHFRERGAGVLINTSSLLGVIPNPIVPTYSMSKFAVRGLTLSLHQSVWRRSPIEVCAILPAPIDTPMFDEAVNCTGRPIRAIPPAISAERVAAAVIRSVRRPRRQRTTGATGALIVLGLRVVPRFTETVVAQLAARLMFRDNITASSAHRAPSAITGAVGGGWRRNPVRVSAGDAVGRALARRRDGERYA
jgi:short-subunit dehydrogenase